MAWFRIKKLIRQKPYLIDPYRIMSMKEAAKIWNNREYPSDEMLLEIARTKLGMTPAEWAALIRKSYTKHSPIMGGLVKAFIRRKKLAAACVLALILALFMVFTAPGKALAMRIYNIVVTIIENMLYIHPADADPLVDTPISFNEISQIGDVIEDVTHSFGTLEEAKEYLERKLAYVKSETFALDSIQYHKSAFSGEYLELSYHSEKYPAILKLTHRWPDNISDYEAKLNLGASSYMQTMLNSGHVVEGFIKDNDIYIGVITIKRLILSIEIEITPVDKESIEEILKIIAIPE